MGTRLVRSRSSSLACSVAQPDAPYEEDQLAISDLATQRPLCYLLLLVVNIRWYISSFWLFDAVKLFCLVSDLAVVLGRSTGSRINAAG